MRENTKRSIFNGPITNKDILPLARTSDYVRSSFVMRCEIWGYCRDAKEDSSLLGCDALSVLNS